MTSGFNCGIDQYEVNQTGVAPKCISCGDCHPGYGRYPPCGSVLQHPPMTSCKACERGTYSDTEDSMPCRKCNRCTTTVVEKCTNTSNTICSGKCQHGFYNEKASHDCQRCSHCCGDGRDIVIKECVDQGMAKDVSCTIHNAQRCTPSTRATTLCGGSEKTRSTHGGIPSHIWVVIAVLAFLVVGLVVIMTGVLWYFRKKQGPTGHQNQGQYKYILYNL